MPLLKATTGRYTEVRGTQITHHQCSQQMSAIGEYREWANGIGDVVLNWARNGQDSGATKVLRLTHRRTTALRAESCS